jgi:hypothetical protein
MTDWNITPTPQDSKKHIHHVQYPPAPSASSLEGLRAPPTKQHHVACMVHRCCPLPGAGCGAADGWAPPREAVQVQHRHITQAPLVSIPAAAAKASDTDTHKMLVPGCDADAAGF